MERVHQYFGYDFRSNDEGNWRIQKIRQHYFNQTKCYERNQISQKHYFCWCHLRRHWRCWNYSWRLHYQIKSQPNPRTSSFRSKVSCRSCWTWWIVARSRKSIESRKSWFDKTQRRSRKIRFGQHGWGIGKPNSIVNKRCSIIILEHERDHINSWNHEGNVQGRWRHGKTFEPNRWDQCWVSQIIQLNLAKHLYCRMIKT